MFGALLFGAFIFDIILFLVIFLALKFTLSDVNIHSLSWFFFYSCGQQYIFSFLLRSPSCTVVFEASFLQTTFCWVMFLWSVQQISVLQLVYWDHSHLRWMLLRQDLSLDVLCCCLSSLSVSISLTSQCRLLVFRGSVSACLECFVFIYLFFRVLSNVALCVASVALGASQCPRTDLIVTVSVSPLPGERFTAGVKCGSYFLLGLFPPLLFKCNCCILYFLYLCWVPYLMAF